MKFTTGPLALSLLGLVAACAAIPAHATVVSYAGDTYTYTIELPDFSTGTAGSPDAASFTFTTTNGAFGSPNSSFYSYSSVGSPLEDGSYPFVALTSADDSAGNQIYTEIWLEYPGDSADVTSFMFIEPESFWATPGTDVSFDASGTPVTDAGLYWNPTDLSSPVNRGDTTLGASYATTVDGVTTDPPLNNVSIDITATPAIATTPEPSTLLMMGTGLMGFAGMVRRKIAMRR